MAIISTPLGFILRWIYNIVGNYGMSLLIFTVLMKIVLIPISVKQKKSSIRTAAFSPMIQQIQKKYANDPAKQQEELARLQQDHNFSMTGGCGTMAVQMIVLIGLIQVVYRPLQYIIGLSGDVIDRMKPIAEGILVSLSKYSPESGIIAAVRQSPQSFAGIVDAETIRKISSFDFTFLGLDLTVTPSFKVLNGLWLIPIISVVLMLVQQTVTMKMTGQKMEGPMKFMPIWSAAMFLYFGFIMPAGVSIYWIFSSIVGIVQEYIMNIFINPEKEKAIIAREVEEARKRRKEEKKARPEKAKQAIKADKERYVAESVRDYDGMDEATRKRLEKARALDREKYGE